jgi:hypothetical protein
MKQMIISAAIASLVVVNTAPTYAAGTKIKAPLPQALSASELAELSGGASPNGNVISTQTLTALNSGNSVNANSVVTGDVNLQAGAFNGFNGIGNFVFNTGNNNNLQGTLSVTIIAPPAN